LQKKQWTVDGGRNFRQQRNFRRDSDYAICSSRASDNTQHGAIFCRAEASEQAPAKVWAASLENIGAAKPLSRTICRKYPANGRLTRV